MGKAALLNGGCVCLWLRDIVHYKRNPIAIRSGLRRLRSIVHDEREPIVIVSPSFQRAQNYPVAKSDQHSIHFALDST